MKKKLLILAGDGIGPEVMNEVKKIIAWFNKNKSTDFDITEELAGGISFDKHGLQLLTK
jgi:Isocitrate/isopropylmalate dehydrogenase